MSPLLVAVQFSPDLEIIQNVVFVSVKSDRHSMPSPFVWCIIARMHFPAFIANNSKLSLMLPKDAVVRYGCCPCETLVMS